MSKPRISKMKGGITAPTGFRAAGIAAGIKRSGAKDLALMVSDKPARAAAVYTRNQVKAAPVLYCMNHVTTRAARAIIVNSGNANACNGPSGEVHARDMAATVADGLQCARDQVFVCSTGRIGVRLPHRKIRSGIKTLLGQVSNQGGADAARAIMTSDTRTKEYAVRLRVGGQVITIGGMAKGAGMIHPQMATMLAFITTDAAIQAAALQRCLQRAVNQSFNRISVDGDMSTNDTVILLANGIAGNRKLNAADMALFQDGLNQLTLALAQMIVRDGEGVSRFVTVRVEGAASDADAESACRSVCNSVLVKSSWSGGDPNWGRVLDALGYSNARIKPGQIEIRYDRLVAVRRGAPARTSPARLQKIAAKPEFTLGIDLGVGSGCCTMYATDLTEEYVRFNKSE